MASAASKDLSQSNTHSLTRMLLHGIIITQHDATTRHLCTHTNVLNKFKKFDLLRGINAFECTSITLAIYEQY